MFVKIKENEYVNLEQVISIYLFDESETSTPKYRWFFETANKRIFTNTFKTKDEAFEWFERNIKPYLNDYNHAKFNV